MINLLQKIVQFQDKEKNIKNTQKSKSKYHHHQIQFHHRQFHPHRLQAPKRIKKSKKERSTHHLL